MARKECSMNQEDNSKKQPMQPIVLDEDGVPRFQENKVITFLFETGKLDLNMLSVMVANGVIPTEDYSQITQMLGYSVSGWGDLSNSPSEDVTKADFEADLILKGQKKEYVEAAQSMTRMTELQEALQVEDDAEVRPGGSGGCWVQAWIFVRDDVI
jgi:hypothetical protein